MTEPVNVLCLKWGTRYPAEHANILHRSVRRHLKRPFRFYCCTDDASELDAEIQVIDFPENPGLSYWPNILVKLMVTKNDFGGLVGPTLFLDLDVAIMGSLDALFDFEPSKNCIIHNWVNWRKSLLGRRPNVGNSSVFRFDAGPQSDYIYQTFLREMHRAEDASIFNTEQAFLTYAMKEVAWWPDTWVRSYKWHCRSIFPLNLVIAPKEPENCKILVFHGRPDPDEAIQGYKGKTPRHSMRAATWLGAHWKF